MIIISHRGNLDGPNPDRENKPDYIQEALDKGFDVEVDVWYKEGDLYLGHDGPEELTTLSFLTRDRIWCHAKNGMALAILLQGGVHCFFIDSDDMTLTSRGIIYGYAKRKLPEGSVAILPEIYGSQEGLMGVCTDYAEILKFEL